MKKTLLVLLLLCPVLSFGQANDSTRLSLTYKQGSDDADKHYKGYKGAGTATFIVSLLNPVLGLAPAIGTTSGTPNVMNPSNYDMLKNPEYYNGYIQTSKKIRSGKVWKNWAAGTIVNVVSSLLVYSIVSSKSHENQPSQYYPGSGFQPSPVGVRF